MADWGAGDEVVETDSGSWGAGDAVVTQRRSGTRAEAKPYAAASPEGVLEPGNIDLAARPVVKNQDGSISTVRSIGVNIDGREYLIPTVSDDGRVLSNDDAVRLFQSSGKHLGAFSNPEAASRYAEQLHRDQERQYAPSLARRGGTRAEAKPYVPADDGMRPGEVGAGRGRVNPPLANQPETQGNYEGDELGRLRDTFFSGVDSAAAGLQTLNTGAQANQLQQAQQRLQAMEAQGQGASPEAEGLRQTVAHYAARLPRMAAGAAEAQADAQRGAAMVTTPAMQAVSQAKTFDEAWEAFKQAPYEIISGVTAQSLPSMLPALAAAAVAGPAVGAAAMGVSSGATEAGSALGEFARDQGVDVTDPQALQAFFSDPQALAEGMKYAGTRAGIIGSLDAASGGVAGKVLAPPLRSAAARQAVNLPAQMGAQAALGAGGEAGAQLATKGEIDQPGQVLLEAAGELGGAPAEVAAFSGDKVRAKVQADMRMRQLKKAAEGGDVEAAVELYALERQNMRPSERRREAMDRFDDFRAEYGLLDPTWEKAAEAAKAKTATMPLAEVPGFLQRFTRAMAARTGRQLDDAALTMLDEPAPPVVEPAPRGTQSAPPATAPEAQLADRLAGDLGITEADGPVDAAEVLGEEAAPVGEGDTLVPASSADLAGENINRNWTAFAPESGTLNLPREQLPQIKAEHRGALVNFLNARGVAHEAAEVPASDLKPTQGEFSPAKVQTAREFTGGDRSILVSNDGYVLDGHHQWLAKLDAGEPVKVIRLDAPIQDLLRLAHQFPSSTTARGPSRAQPSAGAPAQPVAGGMVGDGGQPAAPAPYDGPTMAEIEALNDVPTVEVMREAIAAVGEAEFERQAQQRIDEVKQGGKWKEPSDSSLIEGTARAIVALERRKNAGQPPANPVAESLALGRSADSDGGVAPTRGVGGRIIARAGRTPSATEDLSLHTNPDGTLTPYLGKNPLVDFNSGEDIVLPAGTSDLDAKKAIRAAGAVSNKVNFFPAKKGGADSAVKTTEAADQAPARPAAEAAAQSPTPEVKGKERADAVAQQSKAAGADVGVRPAATAQSPDGRATTAAVSAPKDVAGQPPQASAPGDTQSGGIVDDATGLPLNDDGTVTVYHHTSAAKASEIRRNGVLKSAAEPDVYVTTRREVDTGYGDTAVAIRVDPSLLQIDDEFPNGRVDFRLSVGKPGGSVAVKVEVSPPTEQHAPESQGAGVRPAAQNDKRARAKARMAFNPETDSVLQALAKMGGIRRDVVAKEFGLRPEELRHTVMAGPLKAYPFRKNGGKSLDGAIEALREAGYFTGVADADVRNAFEQAIYNELGGGRELTPQGQMRRGEDAAREAAEEAQAEFDAEDAAERAAIMAEAGESERMIAAHTDDDVDLLASNVSTERAMRELGFSDEEIASELARQTQRNPQGSAAQDAAPAAGAAPAADGAGSEEARAAPAARTGPAEEGLTLEAQDEATLKAKTERESRAAADDKAEQKRLADRAKADAQRDGFMLTGSDRQADVAAAAGQDGLFDIPRDLSRLGTALMRMGYEKQDTERVQAARRLRGLVERLDAGKITPTYFEAAVRSLAAQLDRISATKTANRLMTERERGPDLVREKLIRARRQGDLDHDTVEFALWAIDQNPALAANLGISIRKPGEKTGAAGDYNPASEIVRLFKGALNTDTAVHEILHHAERMMPPGLQAGIRAEWAKQYAAAMKKATPEQKAALEQIVYAMAGDTKAHKAVVKAIQDGVLTYDEHYQLVNPSEFWAVNASRILGKQFAAQHSWVAKVRDWLGKMIEKVKGVLGLKSDAPILRALRNVMDSENFGPERGGRFVSKKMLSQGNDARENIDAASPEANALKAISESDDLFALPKSDKDTMEGVTFDNDPAIKIRETKLPGNESMWTLTLPDGGGDARITVRKAGKYGPSPYSADFDGTSYSWNTERPGDNPDDVDPDTTDVWIDVSQLKGKGQGATIYNIASTFAHNTGAIFIGDPNGVSPDAMRRRPQHMLSSALKFGTTRHIAPHPDQVRGSKKDGIPPLKWVYGDDLGNIRRLVDLNLTLVENDFPTSKLIDFNVNTGELFRTDTGRPISRGALGERVTRARGMGAEGPATALSGGTTVARGSILRALLREAGSGGQGGNGRRDDLLARVVRLSAVHPEATSRLFYDLKKPAETRTRGQPPAETAPRAIQRKVQDQFNRFTVIRDWAKEQGIPLTADSNVWAYEERMHGRIATRVQDFREKVLEPKVKAIQKAGFTMAQVAEYLHAQHAEERNKQIESIDATNKAGSGMETADANAILANADPKLVALANDFRKITDSTKKTLLDAGIINKDMTDAWEGAYKHYVPLKGGPDEKAAKTGTGKGLNVAGKQKRALGHGERSEHIIENILRDHERAIALAEKNAVGHSLLAFIQELGNDDIATIGKPEKRKVLKGSTDYEVLDGNGQRIAIFDTQAGANALIAKHGSKGLFGNIPGPLTAHPVKGDPSVAFMSSPMLAENEVMVYLKGHAIRVQLNDPLLARAYTRSGVEHLNQLMALNREINAFFSRVYTSYNPEFLFTNMARDWTTGLINVTGQYGAGIATKAAANYPKAFTQMLRYSMLGKSTPDIDAYRASGGSTGAAYLSDLERIGRDVEVAYDEYRGVMETLKAKGGVAAGRAAARKFVGHLLGWLEHLNAAGENAMRLAVFEAVKNTNGYTANDAASAAKNSTVNFNRRGEWGPVLGAMYLFFNPAIQGTAAMADSLVNGKHRAQALALVAALPALAYLLAASQFGGGEDDDEAWDAIGDYEKDKNLIIRTGEKTRVTIPIPYGYAFAYGLGNAIYDLRKGKDPDKVGLRVASNLLEHFSPIGNPMEGDKPEARGAVELIPGVVGGELMRHGVRVTANRSGLGGDIVPDSPFDPEKPDVLRLYRSTKGTVYDKAANLMSKATGGTPALRGGIDVSPETLKYWTRSILGGAGTTVIDSVDWGRRAAMKADKTLTPEERQALESKPEEMPIARRFVKEEGVRDRRRQFWDAVEQVKSAQADLQRAKKLYDEAGEESVWAKRGELIAMGGYTEALTKMVKAQRDLVDEVMADESTSLAYKRARVRTLEKEEATLYSEYVREFAQERRRADAERKATR